MAKTHASDLTKRLLASTETAASELVKLNAAMDRLMIATGDGVIPAVRDLAEHLISFLDNFDGFDEREEENEHGDGNADDEPSLGATNGTDQIVAWQACGSNDEREDEHDGCEPEEDYEPSLGSLDGRVSQLRWSQPDRAVAWPNQDMELDEADEEVGIEDLPHDAEAGV